ncbi:hypothetical protein RB597_002451 [Gaeumannomyces tritici]
MAPYRNGSPWASRRSPLDDNSIVDELRASAARAMRFAASFARGPAWHLALSLLSRAALQVRRNLTSRRLLSFPHLMVAMWLLVLLWGERWVFGTKVEQCRWDRWEKWPTGITPHRVVLVADPQLIDPHSYPGRPWPVNPLTYLVTDNYLRRSYNQLVSQLHPSTIFFLGDLFDGGREWKTEHGEFKDPTWSHRPGDEQALLKTWNKRYGQDFWLKEYGRFGDIFLDPWKKAAKKHDSSAAQRGPRIITSLPGNHDLGFGSEVKLSVRNRFETFFGEGNRVDVIGNHTFVSVDTVSLSADASEQRGVVGDVFAPTQNFLKSVAWIKRKAVAKALRHQQKRVEEVQFPHRIEDLVNADFKDSPKLVSGSGGPDFPSILLTHVPLYRPPGTPCGPLREHWPPAKPPKGEKGPVFPDHRNAISVSGGYQYQNVLGEQDSADLISSIGNVVHAFSGDDHDYCELTHDSRQANVREITVKSISMAMGVPTPGFVMVSLYNPIDADGKPLPGAPKTTLQTHLCLLPSQFHTFSRYLVFLIMTMIVLGVRAFLVPILRLTPFALPPLRRSGAMLPMSKAKGRDDEHDESWRSPNSGASGFSTPSLSASHSRDGNRSNGYGYDGAKSSNGGPAGMSSSASGKLRHSSQRQSKAGGGGGKWGWGANSEPMRSPRIEIHSDDVDYDVYSYSANGKWKAARRPRRPSGLAAMVRELVATLWRVVWMVLCIWAWLAWKG